MAGSAGTKVLYVTRKYPPSVGGMEKAAYELYESLKDILPVKLVAYGGPNKFLPVAYPWLFLRAMVAMATWRPRVIYLQDGVMAPMGFMFHLLTRKPMIMTVHGMEVTYNNGFYKALMKRMVPYVRRIVVGSEQTKLAVQNRFPDMPLSKITLGVRDTFFVHSDQKDLRVKLAGMLGLKKQELVDKKLLVTTGRLVERKGVAWFVENVMPELAKKHDDVRYLVAGKGQNEEKIRGLIQKYKLEKHIVLLGYIEDETRNVLYTTADYFVMPNIPVLNDMEGFGLVAVEAASCGTPIIGSGIEGITDAVIEGKMGRLLPAGDTDAYTQTLSKEFSRPSFKRESVRSFTLDRYSWPRAAEGYKAVFEEVAGEKKR